MIIKKNKINVKYFEFKSITNKFYQDIKLKYKILKAYATFLANYMM